MTTYRTKIILITSFALIINFAIISIVISENVYQQMKETRTGIVNQTLQNYIDKLDSFFDEYEDSLNQLARSEALQGVTENPVRYKQDVITLLTDFQEGHTDIRLISYGTESGAYYYDPGRNEVPAGYDPRKRPWYLLATADDSDDYSVKYTEIYADIATGKPIMTMVKVVKDRFNDRVGVLGILLETSDFIAQNKSYKIGQEGFTFITRENKYLIHNDIRLINSEISDTGILDATKNKQNGTIVRESEKGTQVLNYRYYPRTNWTIWSVGYETELIAPLMDMIFRVSMLSLGGLCFSIIGVILFSKVMVRDLNGLKKASVMIAAGDFSYHVETKSNDEVGEFAKSFNKMAERIEMQQGELRDKSEAIHASYRLTILTLSSAIEANDMYTKGHCERVTKYALLLGTALGYNEEEIRLLEYASLLHDIGKIGVPTEVLNKNDKLTFDEYALVKKHPEIGYGILLPVKYLIKPAEILLQHHERCDGTGYPLGIKGDSLMQESRILAIADAYDAMTSSRPYRELPMSKRAAIEQLKAHAGTQFDESLVRIFISLIEDECE